MQDSTHKKLTIVISAVMALGAITALLAYIDNRRHRKLKAEILELDREIKTLEIAQKRHTNASLGVKT